MNRDELRRVMTGKEPPPAPCAQCAALEQSLHEAKQHIADDATIIAQLRAQLDEVRERLLAKQQRQEA